MRNAIGRKTGEVYADTTEKHWTFDVHDNAASWTDPNGNLVAQTFDLNNRLTRRDIVVGPGVSDDTTFEIYKYDGLSRLVHAEDDDSVVTRKYDSLSHITSETQNGQVVADVYDGMGNQLVLSYPGGRVVTTTYDALNRKKAISDQDGMIATYYYVGPGRVERRDYGNNTRTEYSYDGIAGVPNALNGFAVKRITRTRHTVVGRTCASDADCPTGDTCETATGTCIIDDRTYNWDKMLNKRQRKDVRPNGPRLTHDYSYDSIYRLIHTQVTDGDGADVRDTVYNLDGVGNRITVAGEPDPGAYTMSSATPEPADRQMNQYTTTPFDTRTYDTNGNLASIDAPPTGPPTLRLISYDYKNRVVRHEDQSTGVLSTYAYDAFGRRIQKVVGADGPTPETTRSLYSRWRQIEDQNDNLLALATYAFGLYIDEVLTMRRPSGDYYYYADDLYNVTGISDQTGAVIERSTYHDYGAFTGSAPKLM
jgi:YD repeat-containing protein